MQSDSFRGNTESENNNAHVLRKLSNANQAILDLSERQSSQEGQVQHVKRLHLI